MSYFEDESHGFTIYSTPFGGGQAIRTWIYYAGTNEIEPSYDVDHHFGMGKPYDTLKEWDYKETKFKKVSTPKKIAVYRNPFERFISTYYEVRITEGKIDGTLDDFLENMDKYLTSKHLKSIFATQTYHLGKSRDYYTSVVEYKNFTKLKGILESKWGVGLPEITLPHTDPPCPFTGRVCEFELTTPQKRKVREIYSEDFENGWV